MTVKVTYFASLREQRGQADETVETTAPTAADLYHELSALHGLAVDPSLVRVARDNAFVPMSIILEDGDQIVFMPPVAGG